MYCIQFDIAFSYDANEQLKHIPNKGLRFVIGCNWQVTKFPVLNSKFIINLKHKTYFMSTMKQIDKRLESYRQAPAHWIRIVQPGTCFPYLQFASKLWLQFITPIVGF